MRRARDRVSERETPPRVTIPCFEIDLKVHKLEDWVKLTAPAVRSAVEHCPLGRSFVYFYWSLVQMPWNNCNFGHATLFYFDIPKRLQIFFDPSTACHSYCPGSFQYFATNHFWDPGARCEVLDANICTRESRARNLQNYFEPPEKTIKGGSCISVTMLFLLCSLRFQCNNLQGMVDAMRASMVRRKYKDHEAAQVAAVVCLYKWHATLDPKYTGLWKRRQQLLEACHVRMTAGATPPAACGAWLQDDKCCAEKPRNGWALCDKHLSGMLRAPVDAQETEASLSEWWRYLRTPAKHGFPFFLRPGFVENVKQFALQETRIGTVLYRHRCEKPAPGEPVLPPARSDELYHIVRVDGYLDGDGDYIEQLVALLTSVPWKKFRDHSGHMLVQIYHRAPVSMPVLVDIARRGVPVGEWERLVVIATFLTTCMQSGEPSGEDRLVLVVADGTNDSVKVAGFMQNLPDVPHSLRLVTDSLTQDLLEFLDEPDTDPHRTQKGFQLVIWQQPSAPDRIADIVRQMGARTGKLPGMDDRVGIDIVVKPEEETGVRIQLPNHSAHVSGSRSFVEGVATLLGERNPTNVTHPTLSSLWFLPPKRKLLRTRADTARAEKRIRA